MEDDLITAIKVHQNEIFINEDDLVLERLC